jgi:cyclophilin family peptidyl-prolyl cis-trans isomerase
MIDSYLNKFVVVFSLILVLIGCASNDKKEKQNEEKLSANVSKEEKSENVFLKSSSSIFEIKTFENERLLETGHCFLIEKSTLVAPFSLFRGANRAEIISLDGSRCYKLANYYCYDRINNLILLQIDSIQTEPLKFFVANELIGLKTYILGLKASNTQPVYTGKSNQEKVIEGRKLISVSNNIGSKTQGSPVLLSNGNVLGMGISMELMGEKNNFVVPTSEISELLKRKGKPQKIASIGSPNSKRNSTIKKVILETSSGNIEIKLYNETPVYRDNFVQLAEEGYYDNLLIHRVIRDFGIQTGAADTRHALDDDVVGWKGPGYTIPSHIVPGLFHKRGAIGSPRKPDTKNKERRSDGSQFYIVTGRIYLDEELDEIEKENGIKFTEEQRQVYKTIGGAPHLDGSYTVFGEVLTGLNIADKISLFPVKNDFRPVNNIRLKSVKIIY